MNNIPVQFYIKAYTGILKIYIQVETGTLRLRKFFYWVFLFFQFSIEVDKRETITAFQKCFNYEEDEKLTRFKSIDADQ